MLDLLGGGLSVRVSSTRIILSVRVTHVVLLLPLLGHTSPETEDEVESRLLLDVVVREGSTVLKLLSGEDQTLLVWGDTLLVLDLRLDIVDGVRRLDLEGDGLTRETVGVKRRSRRPKATKSDDGAMCDTKGGDGYISIVDTALYR